MPLKVSDGVGAWIKDCQQSNAPQFKGKDKEERRDMALAAYLSAKRGPEKEEKVRQETLAAQAKDVFERQKGMFMKREAYNPKHIKQAIGIASDPRYAKGNMTGAVKTLNKIAKGIDKHPQVAAVLKRQNEAMSDAEKAAHQKAIDAFKAKGGKIKKLKPGYAQGYHGKDDPGAGMKGMLDKGDSRAIGTRKKARSLGASTTREWQEMYGDVILENTKLRKIRQLGMLGLVNKGDVQKLMNAMKAMDAGKEVPKPQRKIIFDAFGSLIDLVTGDTTVFQKAKKAVKEEVEKDPNEYDNEGEMMKDHLDIVMDAADEMYDMVADKENLPEWVQNKITKAADYLDNSRDYLMSQKRDKPTDSTEGKTLSFDQMTTKMMHQEAIRLVRDTNALTRYKTMVNKKQVDDDSIRMAIDNPKHPEVKRLMKNKNFKTGLSHYKKALGVKETSIGYGKAMIKKQRDQKKALITPKDKNTLGKLAALMAKQPKRQT